MRPFVEGIAHYGIRGSTVSLPIRRAEDAVGAYRDQLTDDLADCVIGGHSYGGRVASLLAVAQPPAGLVLLSYPLHRPGRPEDLRIEHWSRLNCPVLLVSGESDPFARIDLLREAARLLPRGELVTYPNVRHGVGGRRLGETVGHIARFVGGL